MRINFRTRTAWDNPKWDFIEVPFMFSKLASRISAVKITTNAALALLVLSPAFCNEDYLETR